MLRIVIDVLREPLFSGARLYMRLLQGVAVLLVTLLMYVFASDQLNSENEARALTFVMLICSNLGLVLLNRAWRVSAFRTLTQRNPALWVVVVVTTAVLIFFAVNAASVSALSFCGTADVMVVSAVVVGLGVTTCFYVQKQSNINGDALKRQRKLTRSPD